MTDRLETFFDKALNKSRAVKYQKDMSSWPNKRGTEHRNIKPFI